MARILIIEDHPDVRTLLRWALESAGHIVTEAMDGVEGLQMLLSEVPDVLVCDLFMPEKDGLEVIQEVRRDYPEVKVIAVSGGGLHGQFDMLSVAGLLGAAFLLRKPFTPDEARQAVEQVLGKST